MQGRGELQEMNEAVLKPKNWMGIEKPLAQFIIFGTLFVFIKKGLLTWGFATWICIALALWIVGLILFAIDPYFIRHRLSAFRRYELNNRYLYSQSYKRKSLNLKNQNLRDVKYIGTRRKKR
jgi:type IV secretory pathway VirB3-like protein